MKYVYLHGFASSPNSTKARYFKSRFAELGLELDLPVLAPDFENLTIGSQVEVVRRSLGDAGEVTLFGSSMGGYLAALVASLHPQPVRNLVLMAPAFDLPARMRSIVGEGRADEWRERGRLPVFHYGEGRERMLGYTLVTEARQYPAYPNAPQPSLVLHGRDDRVVPLYLAEEFTSRGANRKLVVFESGHELTDVLPQLWSETSTFLGFDRLVKKYKIP